MTMMNPEKLARYRALSSEDVLNVKDEAIRNFFYRATAE